MHLGYEIVSCALHGGTLQPFLDVGITDAWLADQWDISRAAIFPDQHRDAYQSILRYWERHGKVPSVDIFRLSFPEVSYRLSEEKYTPEELLDIFRQDRRRYLTELAATDIADACSDKKYDEALELMSAHQAALDALKGPGSLPLLSLEDLDELPDPEPLIEGILDARTVTMLSGFSGTGKSFIALDWALSIASGSEWLGHKAERKRVLYVAAEGASGQKMRVRAWREHHRSAGSPAKNIRFIDHAVQLGDHAALDELIAAARNFDVIIIDTLAKTSLGLDENGVRDMSLYIDALYKIRNAMSDGDGGTVIVVHHTGYDKSRSRGSTSLHAGVDNAVLVVAEDDDPHILMTIKCAKRKDGEPFKKFDTRLVKCGPSAVIEAVDPGFDESLFARGSEKSNREVQVKEFLTMQPGAPVRDIAAATGIPVSTCGKLVRKIRNGN